MQAYQPPSDILEVIQAIELEEALAPRDPRRVDTTAARGSQQTLDRIARKFGLWLDKGRFLPPSQKHMLLFGHTGAGKTTELKSHAARLEETGWYLPVEVNVSLKLDRHNLQYADLLMAMAHALLTDTRMAAIGVPRAGYAKLEGWFDEKVKTRHEVREFTHELTTGAGAKTGIPLLIEVFAKFSSAFKSNATYKEELRRMIRNTFAQLSESFNHFLRAAEAALAGSAGGKPVRIVFVVDGTDKLPEEDGRRLFVADTELLLAVDTLAVYTAPIALKYEGGLHGKLDADLVLPMVKLQDRDGTSCEAGWRAMRDILVRRASASLFQTEQEITRLIEASGGHPRDLLRLLQLCCEFASDRIDAGVVGQAIAQLASEYRRQLEPEDYTLLASIDRNPPDTGNDERIRRLLYSLALLEYNDGSWRRSHPVIRTLEGYRRAEEALAAAT